MQRALYFGLVAAPAVVLADAASSVTCGVDRTLLNEGTFDGVKDNIALNFFAGNCGRNRGVFVTSPSDGGTLGCANFPPEWAPLPDANSIVSMYETEPKNFSASQALDALDAFLDAVYLSSDSPLTDPGACDSSGGFACLHCDPSPHASALAKALELGDSEISPPVRAVTLAGLYTATDAPWVLGSADAYPSDGTSLQHHWKTFIGAEDFEEMKALGLNAVKLPVPERFFITEPSDIVSSVVSNLVALEAVAATVAQAHAAGLGVLLALEVDSSKSSGESAATAAVSASAAGAAATWAVLHNCAGLELPPSNHPELSLAAARTAGGKNLVLLLPDGLPGIVNKANEAPNLSSGSSSALATEADAGPVFFAHDGGRTTLISDIASATEADDRLKMFYHENTACNWKTDLDFLACRRGAPALLTSGFVLAVDDCALPSDQRRGNYGQCDNLAVRDSSGWWHRHALSLAAKKVSTYERGGAGWSFGAWKLSDSQALAVGPYATSTWSLKGAVSAGLFPKLESPSSSSSSWQEPAEGCLVPTVPDFAMGDATYAPSAEPTPYAWVPPPGWQVPTPQPTNCLELPAVEGGATSSSSSETTAAAASVPAPLLASAMAGLFGGLCVAAGALAYALRKGFLQAPTQRGYSPVAGYGVSQVELAPCNPAYSTRTSSVQVQV